MNKIVRADMSRLSTTVEQLPVAWEKYGGRALTSTIVACEVPPACDPLGPHNKLVFAPGLLAGTPAVNGGRLSAGAKSPLTGGIKESSAGGTAGQMLARMGIRALVLEGAAAGDQWYHLHVTNNGVSLRVATDLAGKGNFAVLEALEAQLGNKFGSLSIGPGGEHGMRAASISVRDMSGKLRCHGRGGMVLGDLPESRTALVDMLNGLLGASAGPEYYLDALGKYILKTERQFNLDAGLSSARERLPEFLAREPLPPQNTVWDFSDEEIATFWNF